MNNFIIEPFCPHTQQEEFYICIYSDRDGENILFHHEGGVDIGDVDSKALKMSIPIEKSVSGRHGFELHGKLSSIPLSNWWIDEIGSCDFYTWNYNNDIMWASK